MELLGMLIAAIAALTLYYFPFPMRPKRSRMSSAELEAAYAEAADDPVYQEEMRKETALWDNTLMDGLD